MGTNIDIKKRVDDHFAKLVGLHPDFRALYNELLTSSELVLFGGAIRDILDDVKPRDYDFVVNKPSVPLDKLLEKYSHKRNSFGGYKVELPNFELDVWLLNDTWAFRERYFEPNVRNLKDSVFLNIDSILIELKNGTVFANGFEDAVSTNTLEIVFDKNPMPSLCVLRAFVFEYKKKMNISQNLKNYIAAWAKSENDPVSKVMAAQMKHYKREIFSGEMLHKMLSCCY
ncbi:hypothetical protein KP005_00235 [Geomonas nitrogeniifigens]|uniref:Poly A polymerase head domain-containing protein n=1 Tax=Geomonas diazotrophica TaxID=2843197 RepID=A0ABX8JH93_9BACT|nr:hypothetical protein [Geomonas nitrogeniifigens]QWV97760.1 hypothetical protein KP005_00235 [Geomonas nitrogeniifigens]